MKKLDLKILENADLQTAGRIAELCPAADKKERKKLWRRLEDRLGSSKTADTRELPDKSADDEYLEYEYKFKGADCMKQKHKKSLWGAVAALVIAGGLTGGLTLAKSMKKDKPSKSGDIEQIDFTAQELKDIGYKKSSIDVPEDISMVYSLLNYGSDGRYLLLGSGSNTLGFWITDSDLTSFTELKIPDFRYFGSYGLCTLADGTIVEFARDVDYGEGVDASAEGFDANAHRDEAVYSFIIRAFSPDGTMTVNSTIHDFPVTPDEYVDVYDVASDGRIVLAKIAGKYEVFDIDGKHLGSVSLKEGETIKFTGMDSDDNILCAVENENGVQLRRLNEDCTLAESNVTYDSLGFLRKNIIPGSGDYSCYLCTDTMIYGIRKSDSSLEALFSLSAAGITSDRFTGFTVGSDGLFNIVTRDMVKWNWGIKKYLPCSPEELENITHLKLGVYELSPGGLDYVNNFNEESSDFQIDIVSYYESPGINSDNDAFKKANEAAMDKLREDMLSGELPDIFVFQGGYDNGKFNNFDLVSQGLLYDMSSYLEKDRELNNDTIMPQVVDAAKYDYDGKVYTLSNYFQIVGGYTAKTKFVKDIGKWDISAMLDILENKDSGMLIDSGQYYVDDTDVQRRNHIPVDCWLDLKNAKCHFDTPEFLRFLKYCKSAEHYDPNNVVYSSPEEHDTIERYARQVEAQKLYLDDKALFDEFNLCDYESYLCETAGKFGGEPITTLGDITYDGSAPQYRIMCNMNSFGINASSEYKDYAWEFIKYMFSNEYYNTTKFDTRYSISGFPATKKAMERLKEYEKEPVDPAKYADFGPEFKDYTGKVCYLGYVPDKETGKFVPNAVKVGYITDEVIEKVDRIIESAVPYSSVPYSNVNGVYWELISIFDEETDKCFTGEYSPEQCAEVLQSRLSLYMAENYG